jgi:hypothetical protein
VAATRRLAEILRFTSGMGPRPPGRGARIRIRSGKRELFVGILKRGARGAREVGWER